MNADQQVYERFGFELVGALRELLVSGHDEMLLRETRGTWAEFRERSVEIRCGPRSALRRGLIANRGTRPAASGRAAAG